MNELDLAWAAGFIDGEGYCGFQRYSNKRGCRINLAVVQIVKAPLDKLASMFGGSVNGPYSHKNKPHHTPFWRWEIQGARAAGTLELMKPYFMVKWPQIEKAITNWKVYRALPKGEKSKYVAT